MKSKNRRKKTRNWCLILYIAQILKTLKEEYYDLVAVWIIGTYCMPGFETYPYLFINAQKGSGKTRLLKSIF